MKWQKLLNFRYIKVNSLVNVILLQEDQELSFSCNKSGVGIPKTPGVSVWEAEGVGG